MASTIFKSCLLLFSIFFSTSALNATIEESHLTYIRSLCKSTPHPEACFDSLKLSISIDISPNILNFLLQSLKTALFEGAKVSSLLSGAGQTNLLEKQKGNVLDFIATQVWFLRVAFVFALFLWALPIRSVITAECLRAVGERKTHSMNEQEDYWFVVVYIRLLSIFIIIEEYDSSCLTGTIQDCKELHQITESSLRKSMSWISSSDSRKLSDSRAFLSAALTNKITCLEGLNLASGPLKSSLVYSLTTTYKYVSNSLSFLSRPGAPTGHKNRRLLGVPGWMSRKSRRILQSSGDEYDPNEVLTVAADGTGNFTTINEAINFAPNNSVDRIIIYIKEGVYQENVEIPSWKPNIVLLGDGIDVTVISGNRSVADGWTTFRSATVAVSGEGFLARDITFENTAGPEKHQAVALRVNADLAAIYRCSINGYQDTLYVHSFRQFYRECDISGTIDYIFGNAAVVFQGCNIISRMPLAGQGTVITAQSRDTPDEDTGISIQNCSILATDELYSNSSHFKSFLGRPWRNYSRTVYLESYIDDFIAPEGWTNWVGDEGLDTLYYGEYENYGPGSRTDDRVTWQGFHLMDYYDASNFTVSMFVAGEEWLGSTSFPYDDGV